MDSKEYQGTADRSRININEDYELRYWSDKFQITIDELKAAVQKVGPMANDVETHIMLSK